MLAHHGKGGKKIRMLLLQPIQSFVAPPPVECPLRLFGESEHRLREAAPDLVRLAAFVETLAGEGAYRLEHLVPWLPVGVGSNHQALAHQRNNTLDCVGKGAVITR